MICNNEPCQNNPDPESGNLQLCCACFQAWRAGFRQWSRASIQATTYHTRDGLLIRLPKPFDETLFDAGQIQDSWPPENALPFKNLFDTLPPNRISSGLLDLGHWNGHSHESELHIPFLLGPDDKVWAEIGEIEDLPLLFSPERNTLARQIIQEFLEATQDWLIEILDDGDFELFEVVSWPVPRVMHWLHQLTDHFQLAPSENKLFTGLLSELGELGFQPKP